MLSPIYPVVMRGKIVICMHKYIYSYRSNQRQIFVGRITGTVEGSCGGIASHHMVAQCIVITVDVTVRVNLRMRVANPPTAVATLDVASQRWAFRTQT